MSWQSWLFALNVTVPGLLMLLLGVFLKRANFIDENFNNTTTKLVFNITLPCLIFFSMSDNRDDITPYLPLAYYGAFSTIVTYLLLEFAAPFLIKERRERGIFVQGGFRSNAAIMGIAYCSIAYGRQGVFLGSIYIISTVILFNILSIITLTRSLTDGGPKGLNVKTVLINIIKNPLIISILAGVSFAFLNIPIPEPLERTGHFLSALTLPLAMICAGASMNFRMMFSSSNTATLSTLARSIFVPGIITLGAYLFGFAGMELGVIFLLSATPTAAAGYIMVKAMGGNGTLAANIIAMTTVTSFFTAAIGLTLLRSGGII